MKIGVIFTIYNCEEYLENCLQPWFDLKSEYEFVFTVNSGMFKDYRELGIPDNNGPTLKKIIDWEFDFILATKGSNLLDEDTSRNLCLNYLKPMECDLICLVDGDEIYTTDQIRSIMDYIQENPSYDQYGICFKNHTIRKGLFLNNFIRKSIYWMNRYGGINKFHFDSEFFYYEDNANYTNTTTIPREIAFVEHYSWISDDPRTQCKIQYQNMRYVGPLGNFPENLRCSYIWDKERDKLEFNKDYWTSEGKTQVPMLRENTGEKYTFDFQLDFDRNQNVLNILNYKAVGAHLFTIYDNKGEKIYSDYLDLMEGINYWIAPSLHRFFDHETDLVYLEIEVTKDEQILHSERLHFKT
jgi:hypothetical protein